MKLRKGCLRRRRDRLASPTHTPFDLGSTMLAVIALQQDLGPWGQLSCVYGV